MFAPILVALPLLSNLPVGSTLQQRDDFPLLVRQVVPTADGGSWVVAGGDSVDARAFEASCHKRPIGAATKAYGHRLGCVAANNQGHIWRTDADLNFSRIELPHNSGIEAVATDLDGRGLWLATPTELLYSREQSLWQRFALPSFRPSTLPCKNKVVVVVPVGEHKAIVLRSEFRTWGGDINQAQLVSVDLSAQSASEMLVSEYLHDARWDGADGIWLSGSSATLRSPTRHFRWNGRDLTELSFDNCDKPVVLSGWRGQVLAACNGKPFRLQSDGSTTEAPGSCLLGRCDAPSQGRTVWAAGSEGDLVGMSKQKIVLYPSLQREPTSPQATPPQNPAAGLWARNNYSVIRVARNGFSTFVRSSQLDSAYEAACQSKHHKIDRVRTTNTLKQVGWSAGPVIGVGALMWGIGDFRSYSAADIGVQWAGGTAGSFVGSHWLMRDPDDDTADFGIPITLAFQYGTTVVAATTGTAVAGYLFGQDTNIHKVRGAAIGAAIGAPVSFLLKASLESMGLRNRWVTEFVFNSIVGSAANTGYMLGRSSR